MALKLIPPGKRRRSDGGTNPFYLVRGTVKGALHEYSTGTTDKAEAKAFLDQLYVEIVRDERDPDAPVSFSDAADRYLNFCDLPKKDRTYIDALKRAIGERNVTDIMPDDLIEAARVLYPKGTNATLNRQAIAPAAAILHYAAENGLCPYRRIRRFKEPRPQPRAVDRSVMDTLLSNTTGAKRLLILALFSQGLRIADTLRWEWKRVDLAAGTVALHIHKTDDWLTVHLHDDLAKALRAVPKKQRFGYVFPWRTASGVYKWLRPLCRDLKVKFTPHRARHSFATWRLNAGANFNDVMEAGNWRDPKSMLRYGRVQSARVKKIVNAV